MEGMDGMDGFGAAKAAGGIAGTFMFIVILIFAAIYFFPMLYLLKFSQHTKKAIATLDANELLLAFKNLKSYWVYLGILVIIILAIYILVFAVVGGGAMAMFR